MSVSRHCKFDSILKRIGYSYENVYSTNYTKYLQFLKELELLLQENSFGIRRDVPVEYYYNSKPLIQMEIRSLNDDLLVSEHLNLSAYDLRMLMDYGDLHRQNFNIHKDYSYN